MGSIPTWLRYAYHKLEFSAALALKNYNNGQINRNEAGDAIWKNFFQGKMTFLHFSKGAEMATTIGRGTLLVRKLPIPNLTYVFIGDVVLLKNPENSEDYIVGRLAATEGYEMVSTDKKDEPFVLEQDECWVLADNKKLKPSEVNDSRKFGPIPMTNIIGRVIYCLRSAVDHGPVQNSRKSTIKDAPVLQIELDVEEMSKNHKG